MRTVWLLVFLCGCTRYGAVCSGDDDCDGDQVCGRPPPADGGQPAMGVCTEARLEAGATCAVDAECQRGLFCSNDLPRGERERFGVCTAPQPAGSLCGDDDHCADGLACDAMMCAEGRLEPARPAS